MSTTKKPVDIRKTGPATYRQLQTANNTPYSGMSPEGLNRLQELDNLLNSTTLYNPLQDVEKEVFSPLREQSTHMGNSDYWGNSIFDQEGPINENDFNRLSEYRAENQPWYSKIVNGVGKLAVLGATTALEGLAMPISAVWAMADGKLSTLWDNDFNRALKTINDLSEDYLPNYYTRDEQENPLKHMFNANWLGDGLIKNFGFMIGAFYGGLPWANLLGKAGTATVKAAHSYNVAKRASMARKLMEGAVTKAEALEQFKSGLDNVRRMANATRKTTATIGALSSAINEGMIEALNNSEDWANNEKVQAKAKLDDVLNKIAESNATEEEAQHLINAAYQKYEEEIEAIEDGRAAMGNADLLMNIPILTANNLFQFSKLYARGFESNRRRLGTFWDGHTVPGSLAKHNLKSSRTKVGALIHGAMMGNTEGLEEYLQRAASDASGNAVSKVIRDHLDKGNEKARANAVDYVTEFGKSALQNLGNQSAWNEYFIGAISGALGMPVFGSQTKNAWLGKGSPIGLAGGSVGAYNDYMEARTKETKLADYLNERVQKPEFKEAWQNLQRKFKNDDEMLISLLDDNIKEFKDSQFKQVFDDINTALSTGHYEELKSLVGYSSDGKYTDAELASIVDATRQVKEAEQQKLEDKGKLNYFGKRIAEALDMDSIESSEDFASEYPENPKTEEEIALASDMDAYREAEARINEDKYTDIVEGDFITMVNGEPKGMNETDPEGMRKELNKRREYLLNMMDSILKIRDDIDVETDGRLDDEQLAFLTRLKVSIEDRSLREAHIGEALIEPLKNILEELNSGESVFGSKKSLEERIKEAETAYNNAKKKREKLENDKASKSEIAGAYIEEKETGDTLKEKKQAMMSYNFITSMLERMLTPVRESFTESLGRNMAASEGIGGRISAVLGAVRDYMSGEKRPINTVEMQAYLRHTGIFKNIKVITEVSKNLSDKQRGQLLGYLTDLHLLAIEKEEYNKAFRKFVNDPSLLPEAFQKEEDKMAQEELDNKADELTLRIKEATSLLELDHIMNEAVAINYKVAEAALKKARETGSPELKAIIDTYNELYHYYKEFTIFLQKYPSNVRESVGGLLAVLMQDVIKQYDEDAVEIFKKELAKEANKLLDGKKDIEKMTGEAIITIMNKMDSAKSSTTTHKTAGKSAESKEKKTEEKKPERKKKEEEEDDDASSDGAVIKTGTSSLTTKTQRKKAREDLLKKVEEEIRKKLDAGKNLIPTISNLEEELRKEISFYNDNTKDANERIQDIDVTNIYVKLTEGEEDIEDDIDPYDDATYDKDAGMEKYFSDVIAGIKAMIRQNFISDAVSQYRYDKEGNRTFYEPESPLHQAEKNLLNTYGAYDFVDKGFLGAMSYNKKGEREDLPVYFLRSTDSAIREGEAADADNRVSRTAIFLAVKIDTNALKRIGENLYGKEVKDASSIESKLPGSRVTIEGEKYQIVGILSYNKINAEEEDTENHKKMIQAFKDLQASINEELEPSLKVEAEKSMEERAPFIKSDKASVINSINTGRLDLGDSSKDRQVISLLDFVEGNAGRAKSEEWEQGVNFYFATNVNGNLHTLLKDESKIQKPNTAWLRNSSNYGAVFIMVKKADGKYYPIRCIKRKVSDFFAIETDNHMNLETKEQREIIRKKLWDEKTGVYRNAYFKQLLNLIETVVDSDKTFEERIKAKDLLQKFIPIGREDKIYFNLNGLVYVPKGEDIKVTFSKNDSLENNIIDFLLVMAYRGAKFSLPSPTLSGEKIDGRAVVESDIFNVRLRGYYNFNANFTVAPIDKDGKEIEFKPTDTPPPSPGTPRGFIEHWDFGKGMRKYKVSNGVTGPVVQYSTSKGEEKDDWKDAEDDEANAVLAVHAAYKNDDRSHDEDYKKLLDGEDEFTDGILNDEDAMSALLTAMPELSKIRVINIAGKTWVYDPRATKYENRLFLFSDKENGFGIIRAIDFKNDIVNKAQEEIKSIKETQKKNKKETNPALTSTAAVVVKENKEKGGKAVVESGEQNNGFYSKVLKKAREGVKDSSSTDKILSSINKLNQKDALKVLETVAELEKSVDMNDADVIKKVVALIGKYKTARTKKVKDPILTEILQIHCGRP